MKNILIYNPSRFNDLPNKYYSNLVTYFKLGAPEWANILECNDDNHNQVIEDNKIDVVFFPRCYGLNQICEPLRKRGTLIISQLDDLHYRTDKRKEYLHKYFRLSDIILLPYYHHFLMNKEYLQYAKKACWFPYAVPSYYLDLNSNNKNNKILISGNSTTSYSLRREIVEYSRNAKQIEVLNHPGYFGLKHQIVGDEYINHINKYHASIATSANKPIDYPVLKFFEIASSKSIPVFEKIPSLIDLGFIANKHYLEINSKNYKEVLKMQNFLNRKNMIEDANLLIKNKHTLESRIKLIFSIINNKKIIHWNEI